MSNTSRASDLADLFSPTAQLIAEARSGRMMIVVSNAAPETEGNLVIPAQFATSATINFMAHHGRGLICLALTRARVEQLGLPLLGGASEVRQAAAFTVSIEARQGVTTGISAADRARTVATAINHASQRSDIVTPGHVFPLMARDGGTLTRPGLTEAAVDLAALAGLNPSGVVCAIMNVDGSMARLADLAAFAQRHSLKLGSIADLIAHRRRTEPMIRRISESQATDATGAHWRLMVYADMIGGIEHIVLVHGDITNESPVPVYRETLSAADSLMMGPAWHRLQLAMQKVFLKGQGVVLALRSVRATDEARSEADLEVIAGQILEDLGF